MVDGEEVDWGLVDLFWRGLRGLCWRGWSADREEAEEDKEERIDIEDSLECFSCSISDKAVWRERRVCSKSERRVAIMDS